MSEAVVKSHFADIMVKLRYAIPRITSSASGNWNAETGDSDEATGNGGGFAKKLSDVLKSAWKLAGTPLLTESLATIFCICCPALLKGDSAQKGRMAGSVTVALRAVNGAVHPF